MSKAPATVSAGTTATAAAKPAEAVKARVAVQIGNISNAVTIPTNIRAGGSTNKSPYGFDKLEVGQSIPVLNKTKENLSSIVSNQNRRKENQRQKTNADGSLAFVQNEVKDASGTVVGHTPGAAIMERIKEFVVWNTDPTTDPDKAMSRIGRTK